jgi:2-polyprenyl-3-methyl-5-hydroxy-6-metoxy-1,4-benzoquinol methylase
MDCLVKIYPDMNICPSCKNNSSFNFINLESFSVIECNDCGYGVVNPVPSESELKKLYDCEEYFEENMGHNFDLNDKKKIEYESVRYGKSFTRFLKGYLNEDREILEIGPGAGYGLLHFKKQGFKVYGVEPSREAVNFMTVKLGFEQSEILNQNYDKIDLEKEFDIIVLNHVLEHFIDIDLVFKKLYKNLKKGGILLVRVPNHDSYDRRIYGVTWPAYLPFHIHYFSKNSLNNFFENYGFTIIASYEYFSEQFMVNYPKIIKQLTKKILLTIKKSFVEKFNGRTITFIVTK